MRKHEAAKPQSASRWGLRRHIRIGIMGAYAAIWRAFSVEELQLKTHYFHPRALELVGFIPSFLPQPGVPAAEQFNQWYAHGGGWQPMDGWDAVHEAPRPEMLTINFHSVLTITYPGDPAYWPIAMLETELENVWVYPHAWVAIESKAIGAVEVARMD